MIDFVSYNGVPVEVLYLNLMLNELALTYNVSFIHFLDIF